MPPKTKTKTRASKRKTAEREHRERAEERAEERARLIRRSVSDAKRSSVVRQQVMGSPPRPHTPAGYRVDDEAMIKTSRSWAEPLPTDAERAAMRELIGRLQAIEAEEGSSPDDKARVAAAYEAVMGHPPGQRWTSVLAQALEWFHEDAYAARFGGDIAADIGRAPMDTAGRVLAFVRAEAQDTPDWLTTAKVQGAVRRSRLGRGGGRGVDQVSVKQAVAELVANLGDDPEDPEDDDFEAMCIMHE